jgi:octaprenyl-diphosphate synthase
MTQSILTTEQDNNLHSLLKEDLILIETVIQSAFNNEHLPIMRAISSHIIGSGGKRIRPLLCLSIARLLNYMNNPLDKSLIKTAAAIEFIHTATLLHDDVIDKSDARRGKKTVHLIWGNQASILSGDHMFASAFIILAETNNIAAITMISKASQMLAHGEMIQLSLKQKILTYEEYFHIISNKTAALFASGCACAAIFNNEKNNIIDLAYSFGYNFGIAFQLIDDILDYQGNELFGKPIGSDFLEGKFTLPLIITYQKASTKEQLLIKEIMINHKERNQDDFKKIQNLILSYNSIHEAHIIAQSYINKSLNDLLNLNNNHIIYQSLTTFLKETLFRKI